MGPQSVHFPARSDRWGWSAQVLTGMLLGVLCIGAALTALMLVAKHLIGGVALLSVVGWMHTASLLGPHSAHIALWLIGAGAMAAMFLILFLGLIPHFARVSEKRARRFVRPPQRTGWSGRGRAAA